MEEQQRFNLFNDSSLGHKSNLGPLQSPVVTSESNQTQNTGNLESVLPLYYKYMVAKSSSIHTPKQYLSNLKKFNSYLTYKNLHQKSVSSISYLELVDYVHFIKTSDKKYADKSIALAITSLKNFFKWLHSMKFTAEDPAEKLIAHKAQQNIPPILTLAEYELVLRYASQNTEIYCMIQLFVEGCLKKEEMLLTTLRDFDLRNKFKVTLTVRNNNKRKIRRIDLPLLFLDSFNDFVENIKSKNQEFNDHSHLFDYTYGAGYINKILKSFAEENGIKFKSEMTPQNLRHFGARKYLETHNMEELRIHLGLAPWPMCPELYQMYEKLKQINI